MLDTLFRSDFVLGSGAGRLSDPALIDIYVFRRTNGARSAELACRARPIMLVTDLVIAVLHSFLLVTDLRTGAELLQAILREEELRNDTA